MRILLYGPSCSGKSTVARAIVSLKKEVQYIGVGDITRQEIASGSQLGQAIAHASEMRAPYPPRLLLPLLQPRIENALLGGFILDGYPKHHAEVKEVTEILTENQIRLTGIVRITVSVEESVLRASTRRFCPACKSVVSIVTTPPGSQELCHQCGTLLLHRLEERPDDVVKRYYDFLRFTTVAAAMMESVNAGYRLEFDGKRPCDEIAREIIEAERSLSAS